MSDTQKPAVRGEGWPPRVWLRRVDLQDIFDCGEGCEADVQCLHSPQSIAVTGMEPFVPESLLAQAKAAARAEAAIRCKRETDGLRALLGMVKAWRDSDGNEAFPHDLRCAIEATLEIKARAAAAEGEE